MFCDYFWGKEVEETLGWITFQEDWRRREEDEKLNSLPLCEC